MKKLVVALSMSLLLAFGGSTAFAATSTPPGVPGLGDYQGSPYYTPAPQPDGDNFDNFIGNANKTGDKVNTDNGSTAGDVIKSDNMTVDGSVYKTQRTHGEYANNTNSCASCHQTHTAASKDLLFKEGVYNTCTACHDGTLGFYNVYQPSTAGTFGGTKDGNASMHLATGVTRISAAPGGNDGIGTTPLAEDVFKEDAWVSIFDCASCHAPHGSFSDRLLHYNPNNMANTPIANGGQKLVGYDIQDVSVIAGVYGLDADVPDNVVVKSTAGAEGITGEAADTPVIVAYKQVPRDVVNNKTLAPGADGKQDVDSNRKPLWQLGRDKTPWLYGYDYLATGKVYYTSFKSVAGAVYEMDVKYGKAYAKMPASATFTFDDVKKADIALTYVVKLGGIIPTTTDSSGKTVTDVDMNMVEIDADPNTAGFQDFGGVKIYRVNPDIYDEAGYGVAIGKYCGACHTDYRAQSAGNRKQNTGTGMFSTAFRHTTDNDRYTCLKCHFAHGTDVTIMKDAQDNDVDFLKTQPGWDETKAKAYLLDKNPSSALKRYTNMAVCWKCHTDSKASQLKNNTFFWDNYGTVPHGGASGRVTSLEHAW